MNHTSNYQLSQWDGEDRILRADFNSDNSKIDAALAANASAISTETSALSSAVATLTAEMEEKGNCQIYCTSYTGTGADSRTISFPAKPQMVMIVTDPIMILVPRDSDHAISISSGGGGSIPVSWSAAKMTISNGDIHPNYSSLKYYVTALIQVDA